MFFNPAGNEEIDLAGQRFRVRALAELGPLAVKAMRVLGGRAQVYQLINLTSGNTFALKVMLPAFRLPQLTRHHDLLAQLAPIHGFEACNQVYFTAASHLDDLERYSELAYASLMPWIDAVTWSSLISRDSGIAIDEPTSWALAYQFVMLIRVLERHGIAHCDLSGGNLMVDLSKREVYVIDFDEVYWPGAPRPGVEPTGTPGYRKRLTSQWKSSGDRLAAAIIIGEILGWRDDGVRARASGDTYFTDEDCLSSAATSKRYDLLQQFLSRIDPNLGTLFELAWHADGAEDCPSIDQWRNALAVGRGWRYMPLDARDRVRIKLPATGVWPELGGELRLPLAAETPAVADVCPTPGDIYGVSAKTCVAIASIPRRLTDGHALRIGLLLLVAAIILLLQLTNR